MGFVGVYTALYDYAPQANNELAINEGDLLYILEKSTEDDWWRAKKKASADDADEPEGLIPNNYVQEANVLTQAKALYDYSRQTDEELSFAEGAQIQVYDTSDPDWTLVGLDGDFGFVPANYIENAGHGPPPTPARPSQDYPSPAASPVQSPAAALAGIIQQKSGPSSPIASRSVGSSGAAQFTPDASDDEPAPSLPQRPASQQVSTPLEPPGVMASPAFENYEGSGSVSPGFHLYHIHEVISYFGRNRKMPTTLGINVPRGIIMIAPEKQKDGASKEWTADKLDKYSVDGKHVFMELVRPSKSVDFHAGSKDAAQEIVSALGDLRGAARAAGLREVIAASAPPGHKKGHMLYEFMAQSADEVTVAVGDDVIILDDTQSDEWWNVRRLKTGQEGVVPSSYVEITGTTGAPGESTRDMNRMEEERLAREALRSSSAQGQEVGHGLSLPDRHSSLGQRDGDFNHSSQKHKRGKRSGSKSSGSKPDASRVRTWTDRSGSHKVEAEFIGLKDGKIHLHKVNGVKIAVEANVMAVEDLEYVENATGRSLDEDKPLSDIRRKNTHKRENQDITSPPSGAAVQPPQVPEYDWFDFFLQCNVNPQICERYAAAFTRDQMGEENMRDIDPTLLRTLGLKEGDILRVMKFLDAKFERARAPTTNGGDSDVGDSGGLFSGPGGALRNNTRKGRPAPAVQNTGTVDPRAFEQSGLKKDLPPDPAPTPLTSVPTSEARAGAGFDDDAWDVRPSLTAPRSGSPLTSPPQQRPAPTGALAELSLLSPPLQPTPAPPSAPVQQQAPQPTGADPSFFDKLAQSKGQASAPRQRPGAPQQNQNQNLFIPSAPHRPLSAPQNQSPYGPPSALRPQITGNQPQIAPPGQSMHELTQQRTQQQYMYPQQTGYPNGMMSQQNGFQQQLPQPPPGYGQQFQQQSFQPSVQQQFVNGQLNGSPFADPMHVQQTGFQPMQPQQTGINNFLLPALQPQPTGANGYQPNGLGQNFGQSGYGQQQQAPPMPPMPPMPQQQQQQQQHNPAPLIPQKTGPAPPVRFGVNGGEKKLVPQPTGRANLSKATPQNPFGF